MRRPFTFALACLTLGCTFLALAGQGCGPGLAVNELCGWLKDKDNCYRRLARGVVDVEGARPLCGVQIINDQAVDATGTPYPNVNNKPTFGGFADRSNLETCVLIGGGEG